MNYIITYTSPIGELTVASDGVHITGLWIKDQAHFAATLFGKLEDGQHIAVLKQAVHWLDRYFCGKAPLASELALKPMGTAFQLMIWQLLAEIPYGDTVTYGQLTSKAAIKLGKDKMSAQAVGNAVGRNPISILIPCHRVVGRNGSLTGYAGGLAANKYLLDLESKKG